DALAMAKCRVRAHDIRMRESCSGSDLAAEALEYSLALDQVLSDDLENLVTTHELVVREIDDAHTAAAELTQNLVIGVIDQRLRVGFGRGYSPRGTVHVSASIAGLRRHLRAVLDFTQARQKTVGRHLGHPELALGALEQVDVDRLGIGVVQLAIA